MGMRAKKQKESLVMGKDENPVDFFRRVRKNILEQYDNDISKYMTALREEEKKCKNRLVDVDKLRKKGLIK